MFSFKQSPMAVAVIKDGIWNGRILYFHEKEDDKDRVDLPLTDYLEKDNLMNGRTALNKIQIQDICYAIRHNVAEKDVDDRIRAHYQRIRGELIHRAFRELRLPEGNFSVLPRLEENQRQHIVITAPSGGGKSYWAAKYAYNYNVLFPENRIIVLSKKTEDPAYDKFDFIKRIILDESFLEGEPLDDDDFENSLVIFDDIQNITNDAIKKAVYKLKDSLAEMGRSKNIYMLILNHLAMNWKETRVDNNECDALVLFSSCTRYHSQKLLKEYFGIDAATIKRILELQSRWMFIKKSVPRYVVSEREAFLI